jgi:uncharacterized hydrophobic protein (TIGR00271 family)
MLVAQVYASADGSDEAIAALESVDGVRRVVRLGRTVDTRFELLSAEVDPRAVDSVVASLRRAGVDQRDIVIHQVSPLLPIRDESTGWFGADPEEFVWMQLVGQASRSTRLLARYLILMAVAGIVAAFGVLGRNPILIVGAMAVSPDLLPVCGTCVGIVGRRGGLTARALGTLVIGLALSAAAAIALVLLLRGLGDLDGFQLGDGGLGLLTTVNYETVGIALAAGVAAILAFETNASAGVGVAISVTTIPATAFMGVAIAAGTTAAAVGAVDVLAVNIGLLVVAGSTTLGVQRHLQRREPSPAVDGRA